MMVHHRQFFLVDEVRKAQLYEGHKYTTDNVLGGALKGSVFEPLLFLFILGISLKFIYLEFKSMPLIHYCCILDL